MTREEAVKTLQVTRLMLMDGANQPISDLYYALGMAIEALEQTENSSEKPNNCEPKICDTCRYYNSDIPCGSTPSACKEADKFAEEFVDGLKKLKQKDEPQIDNLATAIAHGAYCKTCKHLGDEDCDCDIVFTGYEPKDEPQTEYKKWETKPNADRPTEITTCVGVAMALIEDEPQTDCAWK